MLTIENHRFNAMKKEEEKKTEKIARELSSFKIPFVVILRRNAHENGSDDFRERYTKLVNYYSL